MQNIKLAVSNKTRITFRKMKFLFALYILSVFSSLGAAETPTTENFIKKILIEFQKGLATIPNCVDENCPQVSAIDCQQRQSSGLQFTTQVIQAAAKCQSNANGVCGTSINRINVPGLAFRVNDSPRVSCFVNNDDSFIYNADQVEINKVYENFQNERNLIRRWYDTTWNNVQYRGSFSCYKFDCDYAPIYTKPNFNLQLQINITARAVSTTSLYKEECVDDSVLNFIPYSNATVSATFLCNEQYCQTIQPNIEKSLKGNYFAYILGEQFNNLVTNALISKLRSCTNITSTIC